MVEKAVISSYASVKNISYKEAEQLCKGKSDADILAEIKSIEVKIQKSFGVETDFTQGNVSSFIQPVQNGYKVENIWTGKQTNGFDDLVNFSNNTPSIKVPLRAESEFWQNIASNPEKLKQYLKAKNIDDSYFQEELQKNITPKNAEFVKTLLGVHPPLDGETKFNTIYLLEEQLKGASEEKFDALNALLKTKHKTYVGEDLNYEFGTIANEKSVEEIKKLTALAKADKEGRLDSYTLNQLSSTDLPSEKLKMLEKLLVKTNEKKEPLFDEYIIQKIMTDSKINTKIATAVLDSDLKIKDEYEFRSFCSKKYGNAVAALVKLDGASVDKIDNLYKNADLNNVNTAYALNRLNSANKKYPHMYDFGNAQSFVSIANRVQDNRVIDTIISRDMETFQEQEPNMVTKFFGSEFKRPTCRLVDEMSITKRIDKNNKEFFIKYIKENKFDGFNKNAYYINQEVFEDLKITKNIPNADALLLDKNKLDTFKKENPKTRVLKYANPIAYKKLQSDGIIVNGDAPLISEHVLNNFNQNSSLSANLAQALKDKEEGKPFMKKYEYGASPEKVLKETKCGDVVNIGFTAYVNDSGVLKELKINPVYLEELFGNQSEVYDTSQGNLGDCYLLAGLNAMMANPRSKAKIYQLFSDKGGDIEIKLNAPNTPSVKFEYSKPYTVQHNKKLSGAKGLQMLEQAFALSVVESNGQPIDSKKIRFDSALMTDIMDAINGGNVDYVFDYYLGGDGGQRLIAGLELDKVSNSLEKVSNGSSVMCFATKSIGDIPEMELNKNLDLVSEHGYSILGYDPKTNIIQYSNPHSAGKVETVHINKILPYITKFYAYDLDQ